MATETLTQLALNNCDALIRVCGNVQPSDRVLIVSDPKTQNIGEALANAAKKTASAVAHKTIPAAKMHGQEPPIEIAELMQQNTVVYGVTWFSMAHTQARYQACLKGTRYLSLPCYSMEVLTSPALQADFRALTKLSSQIADMFTEGKTVTLKTKKGTNLSCNIQGRKGNAAPGWTTGPGDLSSPPDAEANVAPVEEDSHGVLIVDGSIPCDEIGMLSTDVKLTVEGGRVTHIEGDIAPTLNSVFDRLKNPLTRVIAEFGVGLNPLAKLQGFMLEDEGCLGTVHIGIGSNATIGGKNKVPFHLDHIIRDATVAIDGVEIVRDGKLVL